MRPVPDKGIPDLRVKVPIRILLLLGLAILFWASAFVGIRSALESYSPQALALLRFLIASFILGIYALIIKMPFPKKSDIPFFALAGF
ncbi:MAG: EamA family transporter, partial [Bacteroidetes bacterium]|nr:EamA family transporter [Bacteroidota bacterium]